MNDYSYSDRASLPQCLVLFGSLIEYNIGRTCTAGGDTANNNSCCCALAGHPVIGSKSQFHVVAASHECCSPALCQNRIIPAQNVLVSTSSLDPRIVLLLFPPVTPWYAASADRLCCNQEHENTSRRTDGSSWPSSRHKCVVFVRSAQLCQSQCPNPN